MNCNTLSGFILNFFLTWNVLSVFYFLFISDDSFNATFTNIVFLFYLDNDFNVKYIEKSYWTNEWKYCL